MENPQLSGQDQIKHEVMSDNNAQEVSITSMCWKGTAGIRVHGGFGNFCRTHVMLGLPPPLLSGGMEKLSLGTMEPDSIGKK